MSNLDKLSKEDRKHAELLYQLKRNEAFLATISRQFAIATNNEEGLAKIFNEHIEKAQKDMVSVIDRLSK